MARARVSGFSCRRERADGYSYHAPDIPRARGQSPRTWLVEWRCARAHELRRRLSQHAAASRVSGACRRSACRREPDREQGAADSGYPNTAAASLALTNATVADLAHAQGGLVGYVHPFDTRPDPADTTAPLYYELPVDVALGKVDYVEVMGYSDHLITSEIWYRLLNCGFRLPAAAGTDAFPNFASLRGPPGLLRVFVQSGPRLDHRTWLAGLKAGRTFVTNGPLLEFSLAGRGIGDEIKISAEMRQLRAVVRLRSNVPVDHLEIIGNGKVVATVPVGADRMTAADTVLVPVNGSGWYVLRAYSDRAELPVLDLYPFASTGPIYVRVGDEPVRSSDDAGFFVRWIERMEALTRASTAWNTPSERENTLRTLSGAREVFASLSGR